MPRILVVEDEDSLLQTLRYNLTRAGYDVRLCSDGARAVEMARADPPDAMLLDLMLPGLDGLEVCRMLRATETPTALNRLPILMLTARDEEIDKVVGLELGADDYITKPFSMRELIARVKALLRRSASNSSTDEPRPDVLCSGDLEIDAGAHEARLGGEPISLKPREFELLSHFVRHPRVVHSRERLLLRVWGFEFAGDTRTVDVHVRWLRQKIEPFPSQPDRIKTIRGVGYLFTG